MTTEDDVIVGHPVTPTIPVPPHEFGQHSVVEIVRANKFETRSRVLYGPWKPDGTRDALVVRELAYRAHCACGWNKVVKVADAGDLELVRAYLCLRTIYRHARRSGWAGHVAELEEDGPGTAAILAAWSVASRWQQPKPIGDRAPQVVTDR